MISSRALAGNGKPNACSLTEMKPKSPDFRLIIRFQSPLNRPSPSAWSAVHLMNSSTNRGNSTTKKVPSRAPETLPRPPISRIATNSTESRRFQASGFIWPTIDASSAPATPA